MRVDVGRIYAKWDNLANKYRKLRVLDVYKDESENIQIIIKDITDSLKIYNRNDDVKVISIDEYKEICKDYTFLRPDATLIVSDIVSATLANGRPIKDVLFMLFKFDQSGEPNMSDPDMVARAAASDVHSQLAGRIDRVGLSVTKDTIPKEYTMADLIECDNVIRSKYYYLYKTDGPTTISAIIDDDDTNDIFKDLFDSRVNYKINTEPFFNRDAVIDTVDGYCNSISSFLKNSLIMFDIQSVLGISHIPDLTFIEKGNFTPEELDTISAFYGGKRIAKYGILKFDYDIDMSNIRVNYFLIMDDNEDLWIMQYTESSYEIPKITMTDQEAEVIMNKMRKVANIHKSH